MSAESQQNREELKIKTSLTWSTSNFKGSQSIQWRSGKTHPNIGSIPKDPISVLDFADLNAWLTKHKKSWINLF